MSDEPEILMAKVPFRLNARNLRLRHKRLKAGSVWLVEWEIERPPWDSLDTVPDNAQFELLGYWHDGDGGELFEAAEAKPEPKAEKPKKEKEPPHAWGQYWRCWFRPNADGASAIFCPDLIQALALEDAAITAEGVKLALREALDVQSLSREASPELFERFLYELHLDGLITRSRQFVAMLEEAH